MDLLRKFFDPILGILCIFALLISVLNIFSPEITVAILIGVNILGIAPVVLSATRAIKQRQVTIDLLASIALIFSLIASEFASAVFINLMLAFARIFSGYTDTSIHQALKFLLALRPRKARVARDNDIVEVDISELVKGDTVIVKLGERIAVDGEIIEGGGSVDQSSFTGESLPVERKVGDKVLTSTLLVDGDLKVKAEKVGADTAFAQVVRLVDEAQNNKSQITGLGQKFASIYIITILIVSVVVFAVSNNLGLVLSILLVVCADDIAIAIPLAFTAAMAMAARQGILIKGGIYLESLGKLKTLLFDKTGTLTTGKLQVKQLVNFDSHKFSNEQIIMLAGSLADFSTHPVSKAIHQYMHAQNLNVAEVVDFAETSGKGVQGKFDGKLVSLGRWEFIQSLCAQIDQSTQQQIKQLQQSGNNLTFILIDQHVAGVFVIADQVKPESKQVIAALQKLGVKDLVMLTGDNPLIAANVAAETGVPSYQASLLPEDKLKFIQQKVAAQNIVGMVGDGVNDAPALNLATIGIAMGAIGSDVAIESADVVLMRDNLRQIPLAVRLGRRVNNIAKQNFVLWVILNIIGLALVFGGFLTPAGAAAYNFITDIFTILNAMRAMQELSA